ncbi:hypothetical protein [Novosphingobium olei]|uniref:hypothetical protein n=1 Tax=Novosphingobium olei TaxID=2728851 RepID=UPI001F0F0702|nr:hypothetical protein [Novosphingobium olei]
MAVLLHAVAEASLRPRYAFMVLTLIAEAADSDGKAGPFVRRGNHSHSLRDWLSDSLTPMGARDPRRLALADRVRDELQREGKLARDPAEAAQLLEQEVRDRIRISTKTNLSRAVSELVRAGLVRRHYVGFRVDHQNRGDTATPSTRWRARHGACCTLRQPSRGGWNGRASSFSTEQTQACLQLMASATDMLLQTFGRRRNVAQLLTLRGG